MQRLFKFTKLKLITGYITILVLSAVTIVFIYRQSVSFTGKDGEETITQQKLFITSNTLAKLYEAESIGISFSQTGSSRKIETYMQIMTGIQRNMDHLKRLSISPEQGQRVDTINQLLKKRIQNLKDLVQVRYSIPDNFYDKASERMDSIKENASDELDIREKIIAIPDSNYIIKSKKGGWLKKLFTRSSKDSILKVDTTYHHVVDTLGVLDGTNTDTLMHVIRETWNEYQQQKQKLDNEVYRKEIAVIQGGQHITEQIKRVLGDLEKEEIQNTISRMEHQQTMTRELTRTISWIAMAACALVILFVFLIVNDISQSQRYRKALEEAKAYTEKLMHNREKLMLTVTHDIKSPLSSIIGYIELLNNTRLEERQHYFLKNMKSSSEHILHLANNMLDFTKLESKKMEVNTVPYDPGRLLQETVDSFLPLAAQKQLAMKQSISSQLDGHYLGDPMKIRQIVMNILSNAIKYTREGEVAMSAFVPDTSHPVLTIVIKDTGPGMTEEEQELIFKEFTRLTPQHNNGAEGTGLGLTITRQLVQLLGGNLTLASQKGEGSTFTVTLPLVKAVVPRDVPPPGTDKVTPVRTGDVRALVVDDDLLQLTVTTELLKRTGITCTPCSNPLEGMQMLREREYHIVLSDIQMPGMDGFELVKQIRASGEEKVNKIPVIALSAKGDIQEAEYQKAGFTAYLNKPFTPAQLYARVNQVTGCEIQIVSPGIKTGQASTTLYDLKMVMVFADNDRNAANEIIQSFIADCKHNFQLLEEHLACREMDLIRKLAHKMLPMFKQLSVQRVVPLLLFLERMDPATREEDVAKTVNEILRESTTLLEALEKEAG